MHNYYFKLEVMGRGKFPLDQLRRYELFPIDIETTQAIQYSLDGLDNSKPSANRTYTLGMNASSLGADAPCIARFESFGFAAITLELWRGGKLFYKNGEEVPVDESCQHGGYVMREDEFGEEHPYCPACDELIEL